MISIDNDHPQIPVSTKLLNDELQIYEPKLKEWLDLFNNTNFAIEINEIKPKLYDRDFYSLENYLNFDRFKDIDDLNYNYLIALQAYITEPTQPPENLDYKILVDRINGIVKKSGLLKN